MATLKATINKDQLKEDGTYRVRIRITHQRVNKYISTEHYVTKKQITKDFEIKDTTLLGVLNTRLTNYRLKLDTLSTLIDTYTCEELRAHLLHEEVTRIDFIVFAKEYISKIPVKGTRDNGNTTLNSFIDFVGEKIDINEITLDTITRYEAYLRLPRKAERSNNPGKIITIPLKPLTDTGVKDYMSKLKLYYNQAMRLYNDRGKTLVPYNPFDKYDAPLAGLTIDRNLDIATLKKFRDHKDFSINDDKKVNREKLAHDIFMLSFYLIGINAVDMYNATKYEDGRINYSRAKTSSRRRDKAFISIKVEPEAACLVEKYKDKTGIRVFCFYHMYSHPDGFTEALNSGLKTIGKKLKLALPLTYYFARYTWINIARNDCRISKDDVGMAINHADNNHKTTDIYLVKDWKIIDDANRRVINKLLPTKYLSNGHDMTEFAQNIIDDYTPE
jgi:hypothetical protein